MLADFGYVGESKYSYELKIKLLKAVAKKDRCPLLSKTA